MFIFSIPAWLIVRVSAGFAANFDGANSPERFSLFINNLMFALTTVLL